MVGYGFSDHKGHFDIRNLPEGNLHVLVVKFGFDTQSATIQLNLKSSPVVFGGFTFGGIVSVPEDKSKQHPMLLSPQPCSDHVSITVEASELTRHCVLRNLIGQVVDCFSILPGETRIQRSVSDFPSGFYILECGNGSGRSAIELRVQH